MASGESASVAGGVAAGAELGEGALEGTGDTGVPHLDELLRKQGHRARKMADGRVIIEPVPQPKAEGQDATMGRVLSKMKVVTPLMKALEFQP